MVNNSGQAAKVIYRVLQHYVKNSAAKVIFQSFIELFENCYHIIIMLHCTLQRTRRSEVL